MLCCAIRALNEASHLDPSANRAGIIPRESHQPARFYTTKTHSGPGLIANDALRRVHSLWMLAVLNRTGYAERVFCNMSLELLASFRLGACGSAWPRPRAVKEMMKLHHVVL